MGENREIGKDNQLLWHLSEDLKRFKQLTMDHPIIMGRKTHESIGRILPGRKNIVITRQEDYQAPGAHLCYNIEDALKQCDGAEQAFIIGGAAITVGKVALSVAERRIALEDLKRGAGSEIAIIYEARERFGADSR